MSMATDHEAALRIAELERELSDCHAQVNLLKAESAHDAQMLARQCDLAREAETTLAIALDKDARKTKEYNLLVQENRTLRATHAEHLERASRPTTNPK